MGQQMIGVTRTVTMDCVDADGRTGPVEATLQYAPADPYAVTVTFISGAETIPWTFARDLLANGRHRPSGEGDVVVHPALDRSGHAVTVLVLQTDEGSFAAQVASRDVADFLEIAYAVVPAGREGLHLDLDRALTALLP